MVTGYDDVHVGVSESVTIMGVKFYAENIRGQEPVNRREREFTPIIGGTERVNKGKYVHREFSFTTTWFFPTGKPDVYNNLFKQMMSKPVQVISKYMGNFNALVQIQTSFPESSPNHMELDVNVTEIPDVKSNIPGESKLKVPKVKKIATKVNKKSSNNSSSKNKNKKNSKSKKQSIKKKNK